MKRKVLCRKYLIYSEDTAHKFKNIIKMPTEVAAKPRDCLACRLVGSAGLIGIGGYLGNIAWKNQTFAGRYTISTLSFAFIVLGISRYKQTYPFNKRLEEA